MLSRYYKNSERAYKIAIMKKISQLADDLKKNIAENRTGLATLKNDFAKYLTEIEKIDKNDFQREFSNEGVAFDEFKDKAKQICEKVEECILEKKNGKPHKAYEILKKLLSDNIANKAIIEHVQEYVSRKKDFYRIVYIPKDKVEKGKNYAEHRPFEESHLIGNYRFSLPGFPCLYLSGSKEVCEKEVGKGNKGECKFVNQYQIRRGGSIKLLSLAPPINDSLQELLGFLVLYPLILASQSSKKHSEGVFHEEYIIPQLLMEYVRENRKDVDGIRYLSSHYTDGDMLNMLNMMNYVLPVTEIKESGYDEKLMDKFAVELLEEKDV